MMTFKYIKPSVSGDIVPGPLTPSFRGLGPMTQWPLPPLWKKRRVLRNNGPVPRLLAYWHSWLKALVTMEPAIRLTCVVC